MTAKITALIDKFDTFELVRDKLAQILADESAEQQALATTGGKNPNPWKLRVFTERSIPWDQYDPGDVIVNVWFDTANVDRSASDPLRAQLMDGVFNIDVIGFAVDKTDGAGGQVPADKGAAFAAARGLRLVRNILMADVYTYLDLRGLVAGRMPQAINSFQPQLNNRAGESAVGARLALAVRYSETAPQYQPVELQELGVEIQRAEDGSVLAQVDFDYTT